MKRRQFITAILIIAMMSVSAGAVSAYTGAFDIIDDRTLVDQNGRVIRVERPFERIISLYGAHTENLFALGAGGAVTGVSRSESHPPAALEKPRFSYHDDPEKFLAARPDLVLIRPMIDRGYFQLVARLEKSGITVVSIQPGTVGEMYRYWRILGILTGKEAAALEMAARFQSETAAIRAKTKPITPKKRVYFEAIHSRMKTFSQDSMAVFALETAGGVNVADDAAPSRGTNIANYGKEKILSHAHEIDVYLAQHGAMNQPTVDEIRNEPGFGIIKAVREGEIHIIDEEIVSRPTMRLLKGIHTIKNILYPNRSK
jgi:iron complex transport system substrate-binding protein